MRIAGTTLLALTAGCGGQLLTNEGFEIDCDGRPCDWSLVEGTADFTATWHDGDPGADLSGPGRTVIEQRAGAVAFPGRELALRAAVVRDPRVALRFELGWYVAGDGAGPTYWDRGPVLLETRGFDVEGSGVFAIDRVVSTPSPEVSGIVLRVVKDGDGLAIVDEVSLREPVVQP